MDKKLCEGNNCIHKKECEEKKWSWSRHFIGTAKILTSPEFWVFAITTVMWIVFAPKDSLGHWIGLIIVGGVFVLFKPISKLIERGNLNVNANVGLNKNINR